MLYTYGAYLYIMFSSIARRSFANFYKKPVFLLMGAPGVGKGTYGKRLSAKYKMPIFSTGEYLRDLLKKKEKSPLIEKIRSIVLSGQLVDDATILQIIDRRLFEDDAPGAKGIILDGFPRTVPQAESLDTRAKVNLVFNFYLADKILIEKMAGRRECEKCKMPYNVATIKKEGYDMDPLLPKKNIDFCDECNGKLIQRKDDTEEVIADRLNVYKSKTEPLCEYYRKQGSMMEFEPKRGVNDYPAIEKMVSDFIKERKLF